MSRFDGATCDSCGFSIKEAQKIGCAKVVFCGLGEQRRFDLCPQCAARVNMLIGDGSAHEKNQKRG